MKNILLLLLVVLLQTIAVFASTPEQSFEQANQLYLKKEYASAITIYDTLIAKGYQHANLFYNAGNAAYKTKDMGHAVLYLEKALLLDPNDEDIEFNLKLIRLRLVDKVDALPQLFFIRWWQTFLTIFSPDTWLIISILSLFLFVTCLIAFYVLHIYRSWILRVGVSLLVIGLFLGFIANQSHRLLFSNKYAVVMPSNVTVKAAPDASSVDLFPLHEGLKVLLKEEVQGWRKIRLEDGKEGWCTKESVEVI
jgi:tetratricopeptide (TPR) repeat protein